MAFAHRKTWIFRQFIPAFCHQGLDTDIGYALFNQRRTLPELNDLAHCLEKDKTWFWESETLLQFCARTCVLWSFSFMAAVTKWYPLVFCVKCEKIHSKYVNAIILTSRFTKTLCSWNHKKSQQPIILSKNPFIICDRGKNYQVPGYCSGKF